MAPDAYRQEYIVVELKGGERRRWRTNRFPVQPVYIIDDSMYADCDMDDAAERAAAREAWLRGWESFRQVWKAGDGDMLGVYKQALRQMDIDADNVVAIHRGFEAWWRE